MSQFDDRERAFETKYARDEEMQFRILARRNRLLGEWAARLMGLSEEETIAYAKDVVRADFEEAGDEDVIRKVLGDLTGRRRRLRRCQDPRSARAQERRGAAPDHRSVELMPMAAHEIEAMIVAAIPDARVEITRPQGRRRSLCGPGHQRDVRGDEPGPPAPGGLCRVEGQDGD